MHSRLSLGVKFQLSTFIENDPKPVQLVKQSARLVIFRKRRVCRQNQIEMHKFLGLVWATISKKGSYMKTVAIEMAAECLSVSLGASISRQTVRFVTSTLL